MVEFVMLGPSRTRLANNIPDPNQSLVMLELHARSLDTKIVSCLGHKETVPLKAPGEGALGHRH